MRPARADLSSVSRACRGLAAALALAPVLLACGQPKAPTAAGRARAPHRDLAVYLAEPSAGDPLSRDASLLEAVRRLHAELLQGGAPANVEAQARALGQRQPGFHPAAVVAGQSALVAGRWADAVAVLRPVAAELPGYIAAQLALGRAAEALGDTVAAHAAFEAIATHQPLARRRASELRPAAIEALLTAVREDLDRGAATAAAESLRRLEALLPEDRRTVVLRADTAAALGDRSGELQALRWLAPDAGGERNWVERRAAVELEVGDPSAAVGLLEALARRYPDDARLVAQVSAAKARWRLQLLPPEVVEIGRRPELSRSDLAVLLYWTLPEVRAARPAAVGIVTDVVAHPHRTEVLRAINLGLLGIDESLHLFSPERPARRDEAIAALLRAQGLRRSRPACAPPPATISERARTCAAAVACGWIPEAADCLPAAPLSGAEFLVWTQRQAGSDSR